MLRGPAIACFGNRIDFLIRRHCQKLWRHIYGSRHRAQPDDAASMLKKSRRIDNVPGPIANIACKRCTCGLDQKFQGIDNLFL